MAHCDRSLMLNHNNITSIHLEWHATANILNRIAGRIHPDSRFRQAESIQFQCLAGKTKVVERQKKYLIAGSQMHTSEYAAALKYAAPN